MALLHHWDALDSCCVFDNFWVRAYAKSLEKTPNKSRQPVQQLQPYPKKRPLQRTSKRMVQYKVLVK